MTEKEIIGWCEHYNTRVAQILNKSPKKISFGFSKSKGQAGTCKNFGDKYAVIKISTILANVRSDNETKTTIVHELCHAYNEKRDSHGAEWKRISHKVGSELGFNITRLFKLSAEQNECLMKLEHDSNKSPIALIEVPEIGYKKYIYKRCRGYYDEYKGWSLRHKGKKYSITFTKL